MSLYERAWHLSESDNSDDSNRLRPNLRFHFGNFLGWAFGRPWVFIGNNSIGLCL